MVSLFDVIRSVSLCLLGFAAAPSVMMLDRCGHGCDPHSDSECPHVLDDNAAGVLLYACKRVERGEELLLDYSEEYRGHDWSQAQPQQVRVVRRCEHGRRRYDCKECGGAGICEHNRIRSKCKTCRGKAKPKATNMKNSKKTTNQSATQAKTTKKAKATKEAAKQ